MIETVKVSQSQDLHGLQVQRQLFESEHRFLLRDTQAYLRLPPVSHMREAGIESQNYYPVEWQGEKSKDNPSVWYAVDKCEVGLAVEWANADLDLLRSPQSEPQRSKLLKTSISAIPEILATWLRTLFWVSQQHDVYSAADAPAGDNRGGYSVHVEGTGERLNSLGYVFVVGGGVKITDGIWNNMQAAFDSGEHPPLWFNYLFDAKRNFAKDNATGAVISAAIACETAIRKLFWSTVAGVSHPTAIRIVDNVSVQQLLTKWGELTGLSKQELDKIAKSKVHKLFDRRNEAMHYGAVMEDRAEVRDLLNAAQKFILDTDRRICDLSNTICRSAI